MVVIDQEAACNTKINRWCVNGVSAGMAEQNDAPNEMIGCLMEKSSRDFARSACETSALVMSGRHATRHQRRIDTLKGDRARCREVPGCARNRSVDRSWMAKTARCRREARRKACRISFCAGAIACTAMRLSARFSAAWARASLASSWVSSAASLCNAAGRAPASRSSSAVLWPAKRAITAAVADAWRAFNAASMECNAACRAARWAAMRRAISAR